MIAARLIRDRAAATLVEFALVLPVLLIALFGLLESARMVWTGQALNHAAYSTARCRLVAAATCDTAARQIAYAVQRARDNGVVVKPSDVSIDGAATCRGASGALLVSVKASFASPLTGLLPFPSVIEGRTCLPTLAAA